MKKTVIVTITKSIDVEIPDECLTEDCLDHFSKYMFEVNSSKELFEHAGQYVARFDKKFVEGIGNVTYTENYEDVEAEVQDD